VGARCAGNPHAGFCPGGGPIRAVPTGTSITDALGSVTAITNDAHDVELRSYGPFGEIEDSSLDNAEQGFTGHRHEVDLGLIELRERFGADGTDARSGAGPGAAANANADARPESGEPVSRWWSS
jgi:hypothetical protein